MCRITNSLAPVAMSVAIIVVTVVMMTVMMTVSESDHHLCLGRGDGPRKKHHKNKAQHPFSKLTAHVKLLRSRNNASNNKLGCRLDACCCEGDGES